MPNKVFAVSHRHLPPFLSYRQKPGAGRICPNLSGTRAKRLADWCGSETGHDFIRQWNSFEWKKYAEEIRFLHDILCGWCTTGIHGYKLCPFWASAAPWSWRGRTGNLKWWKCLERKNIQATRGCAENGGTALLGRKFDTQWENLRAITYLVSYIHFTNVYTCWFLSEN